MTLRPLRPEDRDLSFAFVSGLSPETRRNRLLGGMIAITPEYIESLVRVDYSRAMAIAATTLLERETMVGAARYILDPDRGSAEFAIVVADAWHGRGIGKRLMSKLIEVARRRGLKRLHGEILAMNRPMLGLVRSLGFTLSRHEDPMLSRATLEL